MVAKRVLAGGVEESRPAMPGPSSAASFQPKSQEQGWDTEAAVASDRERDTRTSNATDLSRSTQAETQLNDQHSSYPATDFLATGAHPAQDAGDLGLSNLSLSPAHSAGNTNPFRKKSSRSASPVRGSTQAGVPVWDEDTDELSVGTPEDLQNLSWNDTAPSSTQVWSEELGDNRLPHSAITPEVDLVDGAAAQHGKGKAPMITPPDQSLASLEYPEPVASDSETPRSKADRQRNEVYQIRHIRWHDEKCSDNPRSSPILTQNANGPCPLLALVNALSLSTPAELITPFIDTLRTREQISLGLLLDAVFEELMSERRSGDQAVSLPDVGELYAFLITLHTGMNVNPRFVPSHKADGLNVGDFEDTREMKLYRTFKVPLIHGWISHEHELAHQAFARTAPSYEDAQNVQFQEEDLRLKLGHGTALKPQEQALLDDLEIVKQFFSYWPTQLTAHGLDVMKQSVPPGDMFILFRNDHFSMVYKEPRSGTLFTLVTDAGYASHDEIVWESLVDISGSGSEWYSGDFRSVSHNQPVGDAISRDDGWTTVKPRNGRKAHLDPDPVTTTNDSLAHTHDKARSASEQEDLDLVSCDEFCTARDTATLLTEQQALALQLQEEEEERDRHEASQRRARENKLSRDFIDQQSSTNPNEAVQVPLRRSGQTTTGVSRTDDGPDAPPSYEQAASSKPYRPSCDHPLSEHAPRVHGSAYSQQAAALSQAATSASARRRMSARQSLASQMSPSSSRPSRLGRIETGMNSSHGDKEDKCSIM